MTLGILWINCIEDWSFLLFMPIVCQSRYLESFAWSENSRIMFWIYWRGLSHCAGMMEWNKYISISWQMYIFWPFLFFFNFFSFFKFASEILFKNMLLLRNAYFDEFNEKFYGKIWYLSIRCIGKYFLPLNLFVTLNSFTKWKSMQSWVKGQKNNCKNLLNTK